MELFHHFVGGHDSRICHAFCMGKPDSFPDPGTSGRDREDKDAPSCGTFLTLRPDNLLLVNMAPVRENVP